MHGVCSLGSEEKKCPGTKEKKTKLELSAVAPHRRVIRVGTAVEDHFGDGAVITV